MNHYIPMVAPREVFYDGQGLFIDGKGLIIECAIHGKKTPKKPTKKVKAGGLEGVAVALECIKETLTKPYPGDITPGSNDVYPLPPWPKGGTEEITVRVEGSRDILREGWGGGNAFETDNGIEGHGGGVYAEGCGG